MCLYIYIYEIQYFNTESLSPTNEIDLSKSLNFPRPPFSYPQYRDDDSDNNICATGLLQGTNEFIMQIHFVNLMGM